MATLNLAEVDAGAIEVKLPDGKTYKMRSPDALSLAELREVQKLASAPEDLDTIVQLFGFLIPDAPKDAILKIPVKKVREFVDFFTTGVLGESEK